MMMKRESGGGEDEIGTICTRLSSGERWANRIQ